MDKNIAKQKLNCTDSQSVLALLGGSQGSSPLNRHFKEHIEKFTNRGIQVLWQCGKNNYDELRNSIDNEMVNLFPFSNDMGAIYSAADLIISRAGALALSEMSLMEKAMVLVPFPHSAGNHQVKNAESFSKSGAAEMVLQSQLEAGLLEHTILDLIQHPEKIQKMEEQSKAMATPDATGKIIAVIMEVAQS